MQTLIQKPTAEKRLVVLLEDDAGVRRSLQLLLRGRGFDVRAYATPESLLADHQAGNADCLLVDYRLTAMDGIAVLNTLRSRGWTGPAILMSAFGTEELSEKARSAGFSDFLDKPFKDHALVAAIQRTAG